ncbi:MAG: hypothetical protein V1909_05995 [Candidatus Micrarchaeota archaeon]
MYEDEAVSVNSEVRYISLELMKIAAKEKRDFKEVAGEFVDNVYYMHQLIQQGTGTATASVVEAKRATRR